MRQPTAASTMATQVLRFVEEETLAPVKPYLDEKDWTLPPINLLTLRIKENLHV